LLSDELIDLRIAETAEETRRSGAAFLGEFCSIGAFRSTGRTAAVGDDVNERVVDLQEPKGL
jgi:hypothetical protein